MHHCLQITEILINIFESYNGCDRNQSKHTLLQLALVCKMFHEPALDVLWKFQSSFSTLVKTLPPDLWEEIGEPTKLVRQLTCSYVNYISDNI